MLSTLFALHPSSLSFSLSLSPFSYSRAVRALPAVPLICRFVCAFKHESPRCGVEQREALNGKRRREERARSGRGETKRGKGRRTREGERGKNGGEKQGERDDFTMRGRGGGGNGSSTLVKISSGPTKGKVRPSSLQTSPRTFNFPLENPGFPPFLFPCFATTPCVFSLEPSDSLSQLCTDN